MSAKLALRKLKGLEVMNLGLVSGCFLMIDERRFDVFWIGWTPPLLLLHEVV